MNDYINDGRIRQLTFISALVLLGYILFSELKSFIPAFLGALTLYVIMRKWMFRLVYFRKWKPLCGSIVNACIFSYYPGTDWHCNKYAFFQN